MITVSFIFSSSMVGDLDIKDMFVDSSNFLRMLDVDARIISDTTIYLIRSINSERLFPSLKRPSIRVVTVEEFGLLTPLVDMH